ncbi:MAG: T9SS type A sorting domain-containing protein [Lewinellaceae bacterium]|nr:T9SS type A sorting domain-containing protein [Lewinella sp.]MCB9280619.1 T9SS type A sorting domain-containing protein [Lewinellaceae bacterium]
MRNFTLILFFSIMLFGYGSVSGQLDDGTGVTWGELSPVEPLVLDENFQGFQFFHTDANSDMGNSDNAYDGNGGIIYGYKNDTTFVPVIGEPNLKIWYFFKQCAFAPEWKAAYAYRDGVENTENVSDGFVEISRDYPSDPPAVRGDFIVDLRALDFVEVIQWTHSSTGGNKRGVMCEISLDDGATWDTLRYQPGTNWAASFTKDPVTGIKTSNGYRCQPSAYGMTWEDGIYTSNVMLKFLEAGGQTPRIHDLKVYGTFTPVTAVKDIFDNDIEIVQVNRRISVSETSDLAIFRTDGSLTRTVSDADQVDVSDLPSGIYIVRAQAGKKVKTEKVFLW